MRQATIVKNEEEHCRSAQYESLGRIVEEFQADLDRIVELVAAEEDDQHKAELLQVIFFLGKREHTLVIATNI